MRFWLQKKFKEWALGAFRQLRGDGAKRNARLKRWAYHLLVTVLTLIFINLLIRVLWQQSPLKAPTATIQNTTDAPSPNPQPRATGEQAPPQRTYVAPPREIHGRSLVTPPLTVGQKRELQRLQNQGNQKMQELFDDAP